MEDHNERAKELFAAYYGSYFQMHRAGYYNEYQKYEISKDTEAIWLEEMIVQRTSELSIRSWEAVHQLLSIAKNNPDSRILDAVISFTTRHLMSSDSVVKLMYAENIIEIIKLVKGKCTIEQLHEACKVTALLLEDIIAKPLIIDPGHELILFQIKDKRALNLRAKNNIDLIKGLL
ncbi:hypothetical protein FHS15_005221 [Paenibacillus castaneae]|uniref:hypothetical protein n=1 Tax=Paenibacillus castaneae TaxID=474957 RepID=UPI000C9B7B89|nr:hypothetical protein [Paenibacillus castaneae]NIK80037.1 hypothetical protein [Paenibacillus castaneae]